MFDRYLLLALVKNPLRPRTHEALGKDADIFVFLRTNMGTVLSYLNSIKDTPH